MRIINVTTFQSGMINEIQSFAIWEEQTSQDVVNKAEEYFKKMLTINASYLTTEDIESILDDGYYDNQNGWEISIVWSEVN